MGNGSFSWIDLTAIEWAHIAFFMYIVQLHRKVSQWIHEIAWTRLFSSLSLSLSKAKYLFISYNSELKL